MMFQTFLVHISSVRICRQVLLVPGIVLAYLMFFSPGEAASSIPNHLYRIDIRSEKDYTRLTIRFAAPPQYILAAIPGNRLRIVIEDSGGTLYKKFRRYSDKNIGGLVIKRRGNNMLITFQIAKNVGWRDLTRPEIAAITLDIGGQFKSGAPKPSLASRDKIWSGIEKLVRDFDPPLKSEIPFSPTDRQILGQLTDKPGQQDFMVAEAALYKGQLTEAEQIFAKYASLQTQVRGLALYRLGETWYKLQKYPQALAAFREAEKLWPSYPGLNPGVTFYYGDSIARSGELSQARALLSGLVSRLADKTFAPALLVRLGDILTRQGHENDARAIYRNVADHFKENKASKMAAMRNADGMFLVATPWNYRAISDIYLRVSQQSGDLDMREESHFKHVLLECLHGEAGEALQQLMLFQRKFPRSVYAAIARNIRVVLVAEVYSQTQWDKDFAALVRFVEEQQEYLGDCVEQPGFPATLSRAYNETGRPIELIRLLTSLIDHPWASSVAPELYVSIVDNAELIGDTATAERTIRAYLSRFPNDAPAKLMTERLGSIYFTMDQHQKVKDTLLWLLGKGAHAQRAESYYQLGRSLWTLQSYPQAARSMELYLAATSGRDKNLVPDAYFIVGSARESMKDRKAALKAFEAAIALPDNKRNEEFVYRAGQINLLEGNHAKAKKLFGQLINNGKDPDWKKLARQAMSSIEQKGSNR